MHKNSKNIATYTGKKKILYKLCNISIQDTVMIIFCHVGSIRQT